MAYRELIKDFQRIRSYMRQFYVFGFKNRKEYDTKSARSYDDARRRVESWLGEYMFFRRNSDGKRVFLSVDSRSIPENPFYKAFKAKSFTDRDITLHFLILDLLREGVWLTSREIMEGLERDYLSHFDVDFPLDQSTLRKKLKEYSELGIIVQERKGHETVYARAVDGVDLEGWREAVAFFTEASPLGAVGSFLRDKDENKTDFFCFKHHYLLHALDSEVLCLLLEAIGEARHAELTVYSVRDRREQTHMVYPMKIYVSTQSGREYLLCHHDRLDRFQFFRLDAIIKVIPGASENHREEYLERCSKFVENLWGVSTGERDSVDRLELTLRVEQGEEYLLRRLEREKRTGRIERVDDFTYRYLAEVRDARELLPWLRTFIGRIIRLECSNQDVADRFYKDLDAIRAMYEDGDKGGD